MTEPSPDYMREAADPATPQQRLAEIAATYPAAQATIAANPSCYPGLLDWIEQVGDQAAKNAVAQVRARTASQAILPGQQAPVPQQVQSVQPIPTHMQQPHPQAQTAATTPLASLSAPHATTPGELAPRKRKRGLLIGLIAAGLVVILGGTLSYAFFFSKLGGASSPTAAVEKLVGAVSSKDMISAYGAIAPSEISTFKPSLEQLQKVEVKDNGQQRKAADLLNKLTDSVEITFDDVGYKTENIDDGIELVTATDGTMTVKGDGDTITDALVGLAMLQAGTTSSYLGTLSEDELRDQFKRSIGDALPYEINIADVRDELGFDPVFMTVKEGGSWYVSPLLSGAEYVYQANYAGSGSGRGTLPDAKDMIKYDSPEAAAEGLSDAILATISTGDVDGIASSLPLAERRLVAIYGPPLLSGFRGFPLGVSVTPGFSSNIKGNRAELSFDDFIISMDSVFTEARISVTGVCATLSGGMGGQEFCLTDPALKPISKLGVEDWHLTALKEDGGWFLSPLASASDILTIVSAKVQEHSEDGTLDELFG